MHGKPNTALRPRTGIRELADHLGLSISTISRAMNNRYGVDEQTRERVLRAARTSGYIPDAAARKLKSHLGLRVEVVFSPFHAQDNTINPAAMATIHALRKRAAASNVALTVNEVSALQAQADIAADLQARILSHSFDVVITYGSLSEELLAVLLEGKLPVVCLQSRLDSVCSTSVVVDTHTASYEATQYLAALGHRRVALVAGDNASEHHRNFVTGFAAATEEYGLYAPEPWRIRLPAQALNASGAAESLVPLLSLPAGHRPTAIVFASDWLAMGGFRAASTLGLQIPADLSIVGFDNIPEAARQQPPLTTFDVHQDTMAQTILDAAVALAEKPDAAGAVHSRTITINADMVKRASCQLYPCNVRIA